MRIIGLDEFLKMPAGTVYSKYEPVHFWDLAIKGDTLAGTADWFYATVSDGDFNTEMRDGCFEPAQLFAVWDATEVSALISRLQLTLDYARQR